VNALIKLSPAHKEQGALRWVLTKKKEKKEANHITNLGSYSHLFKSGASPTGLTFPTLMPGEPRAEFEQKGSKAQYRTAVPRQGAVDPPTEELPSESQGPGNSVQTSPAQQDGDSSVTSRSLTPLSSSIPTNQGLQP